MRIESNSILSNNMKKIFHLICFFPFILVAQQGEILHPGQGVGLVVKSISSFSTIDVDAFNGDAAFRFLKNGVTGFVMHSDALNGDLKFTEFGQPTRMTISSGTGNVHIAGILSKGGGAFKIDHPMDPENKYLLHSFVESPDMLNIYNGKVETGKDGKAWVELPGYFESLNRDFCYQLTVIGSFAQAIISKEITSNRFEIATDIPFTKVSWQVTGIRNDPFAQMHRIPNVMDKEPENRGTYLHPKAYGKSIFFGQGYKMDSKNSWNDRSAMDSKND